MNKTTIPPFTPTAAARAANKAMTQFNNALITTMQQQALNTSVSTTPYSVDKSFSIPVFAVRILPNGVEKTSAIVACSYLGTTVNEEDYVEDLVLAAGVPPWGPHEFEKIRLLKNIEKHPLVCTLQNRPAVVHQIITFTNHDKTSRFFVEKIACKDVAKVLSGDVYNFLKNVDVQEFIHSDFPRAIDSKSKYGIVLFGDTEATYIVEPEADISAQAKMITRFSMLENLYYGQIDFNQLPPNDEQADGNPNLCSD